MIENRNKLFRDNKGQQSFSLFETVIAIGMLATVLLNVNGIQGQAVYSVEYQENLSKAVWLAKGIMAKVDYEWNTREFKELEFQGQEQSINDISWGSGTSKALDGFTYRVTIEEWKLPIIKLLTGSMGGGGDSPGEGGAGGDMIMQKVKEVLGDDLMKLAHVQVFWPEGIRRGSTQLTYALTNQNSLNTFISKQKSLMPEAEKKDSGPVKGGGAAPTPTPNPAGGDGDGASGDRPAGEGT